MKRAGHITLWALISCLIVSCEHITNLSEVEMTGQRDMKIDYIEFPTSNMSAMKDFYTEVFGWEFIDYGPDYASFARDQAGVDGGFDTSVQRQERGMLVVFYADDLELAYDKVKKAGGKITVEIFSFPGGRRFHFEDPSGNELAIWAAVAE